MWGRRRPVLTALAVACSLALLAGCGGSDGDGSDGGGSGPSSKGQAVDDGSQLTMWIRSGFEEYAKALVDTYNKSHKNKVKLTVVPGDGYQAKVAAAAGAGKLPDVLSADVIYMPNYTSKGLMLDLTDRIAGLSFGKSLAPGAVELASWEGKKYGVPFYTDLSALYWNKELFERAGLDPEKAPASTAEMLEAAKAVSKLGGGVSGLSFGGNCGGCMAFTGMPIAWASGGDIVSDDGTTATFTEPGTRAMLQFYRDLWVTGAAWKGARQETGETADNPFLNGKAGMQMGGPGLLAGAPAKLQKVIGVGPIPGKDGDTASFQGGDVLGIPSTTKKLDQAWHFVQWVLSEEAHTSVIAKGGYLPLRTDLSDVGYGGKDPRVKTFAGLVDVARAPRTVAYGQIFNDPQGPWLAMFRRAVFDGDIDGATAKGKEAADSILSQAAG
jgi:multiple sugar transport system substrate-binding protein